MLHISRATWSTPSEPYHKKPFSEVLSFSALFGPGSCCKLVCFEFGVLNFRLPLYTRNGQVGGHVLLLWFLALVLAGCCCQLVCFEFVVLHFRLPIPETPNGQIIEHVRTEKKQKRPCQCSGKASVYTAQEVALRIAALAHLQEKAPRGATCPGRRGKVFFVSYLYVSVLQSARFGYRQTEMKHNKFKTNKLTTAASQDRSQKP